MAMAQDDALLMINGSYQSLLDDYGSSGEKNNLSANMIDYSRIKNDDRLLKLTHHIQNYPKERLNSQAKKLAFYLNAYNILSIAMVAKHWPITKLKSLGTLLKPVWTHSVGAVCGEQMTLRKLEHEILGKLGNPKIHFALNCASMSCPDLRLEPYLAESIEEQLENQTTIFMSQKGKGVFIKGEGKVKLSPIFDWFSEDFDVVGGVNEFVQPYLPEQGRPWEIVGYLNYDWSVNWHLTRSEKLKINRRKKKN